MTAAAQANGRRDRAQAVRPPRGFDVADPDVLFVTGALMCCQCMSLIPNTAKAARRHNDNLHLRLDHPVREDAS